MRVTVTGRVSLWVTVRIEVTGRLSNWIAGLVSNKVGDTKNVRVRATGRANFVAVVTGEGGST